MAYDGKLLASARDELEKIRQNNIEETLRRQKYAYFKIDGLELIDLKMRSQMTDLVRLTLKKPADFSERVSQIKQDNLELQAQKAELLVENGLPMDYLEPVVSCQKCNDTGSRDGHICDCLQKLYNKEVTKNLSALMLNGDEAFDHFRLEYYPVEYDLNLGASPADYMAAVFRKCRSFAETFPCDGRSLLFQGGTGLGKTYLSACIAREISDKGFSVCYDTASSALNAFERQKFSKDAEEAEAASSKVNRILDCDLLILDDLGTEMITSISISALYTIINTRLISRKSTVISTNLSNEELAAKYSPQICSRMEGGYEKLPFVGKDIRILKKSL